MEQYAEISKTLKDIAICMALMVEDKSDRLPDTLKRFGYRFPDELRLEAIDYFSCVYGDVNKSELQRFIDDWIREYNGVLFNDCGNTAVKTNRISRVLGYLVYSDVQYERVKAMLYPEIRRYISMKQKAEAKAKAKVKAKK